MASPPQPTSPVNRLSTTPPPTNNYFNTNFFNNRMRVQNDEFENVTEIFEKGCSALELGELIHSPHFGLQDAMAACEMMDPKMDSGFTPEITSITQFNINTEFNYNDTLGIMDRLFSLQIEWYFGHPPLQTLFTSYYFHHATPQLSHATSSVNVINTFVHLIKLCCHFVSTQMSEEGAFYEGEDFSNQLPHGITWCHVQSHLEERWVERSEELVNRLVEGLNTRDRILDLIIHRLKTQVLWLKVVYGFYSRGRCDMTRGWTFDILNLWHSWHLEYNCNMDQVNSAFNFNLANLISGQVPPRPIAHWSFDQVRTNYRQFLQRILFITNLSANPYGVEPTLNSFSGLALDNLLVHHASQHNCAVLQVWTQSLLYHRSFYFGGISPDTFLPAYIEWFLPTARTLPRDYQAVWDLLNPFIFENLINSTKNPSRQRRESCKLIMRWEGMERRANELLDAVAEQIELDTVSHIVQLKQELILELLPWSDLARDLEIYIDNPTGHSPEMMGQLKLGVIGLQNQIQFELVSMLTKEINLLTRWNIIRPLEPLFPSYFETTFSNRFRMFSRLDHPIQLEYNDYLRKWDELNRKHVNTLIQEIFAHLESAIHLIQLTQSFPSEFIDRDETLLPNWHQHWDNLHLYCTSHRSEWARFLRDRATVAPTEGLTPQPDQVSFEMSDRFPYFLLHFNPPKSN